MIRQEMIYRFELCVKGRIAPFVGAVSGSSYCGVGFDENTAYGYFIGCEISRGGRSASAGPLVKDTVISTMRLVASVNWNKKS